MTVIKLQPGSTLLEGRPDAMGMQNYNNGRNTMSNYTGTALKKPTCLDRKFRDSHETPGDVRCHGEQIHRHRLRVQALSGIYYDDLDKSLVLPRRMAPQALPSREHILQDLTAGRRRRRESRQVRRS